MKKVIPAVITMLMCLCAAIPSHGMGRSVSQDIYRVSDGATISYGEMIRELEAVEIVFVGEQHTNQSHHKAELDIIRSLSKEKKPIIVALEMFRKDQQKALDRWVSGDIDEAILKNVYLSYWRFPWELYSDIFLYCRKHEIPMVGLNVPSEVTRQVARQGFNSLTPEQRGQLHNVGCVVGPEYEAFIRRAYSFHQHSGEIFTHFCEAQLVWDTAMAWNLIDAVDKYPGHLFVVLAGNGHAWKYGIPRQVAERRKISYRVVLPEIPDLLDPENVSVEEADYLWLYR